MLCANCQKNFSMPELQSHEDGMVPGLIGMKANKMLCRICADKVKNKPIAIDDTSQFPREKEDDPYPF